MRNEMKKLSYKAEEMAYIFEHLELRLESFREANAKYLEEASGSYDNLDYFDKVAYGDNVLAIRALTELAEDLEQVNL